jgi:hypothetical protein
MIERGMADKPRVRVRGVVWLTSQHEHQRSSYNSHARVGSTKTTSLDAKPPLEEGEEEAKEEQLDDVDTPTRAQHDAHSAGQARVTQMPKRTEPGGNRTWG